MRAVAVALVVAMGIVAGCGSNDEGGAATGGSDTGPVKIGVQIAQTGIASSLGVPALDGIEFAVDAINEQGGLDVGGKQREIELVVRDDASNPDTARAVTQQLITEDEVDALIAGVYSNVVAPALVVAERYGVAAMSTFAYSPAVMPDNPKYAFVNVPSTVDQFNAPLAFMKSIGIHELALVATNDDLGQGFLEHMPELASQYDIEIAAEETIESNTTDFAPIMERLKRIKAPAVIVEAGPGLSYQFRVAQAKYHACQFKVSHYEYGPGLQPDWVDGTKDAGIGGLGQTYWWADQKGFDDKWFGDNAGFVKAFTAEHGKPPVWATAQGVQSAELIALAIEKAGSSDRQAIADAIPALDGTTLMGPIRFEGNFNRGFIDDVLVIQQHGPELQDAVVVGPEQLAKGEFKPDTCG